MTWHKKRRCDDDRISADPPSLYTSMYSLQKKRCRGGIIKKKVNNAGILACRLSPPEDSDEDDNGRNEEGAYGMATSLSHVRKIEDVRTPIHGGFKIASFTWAA